VTTRTKAISALEELAVMFSWIRCEHLHHKTADRHDSNDSCPALGRLRHSFTVLGDYISQSTIVVEQEQAKPKRKKPKLERGKK
jgi:hypothetical protein